MDNGNKYFTFRCIFALDVYREKEEVGFVVIYGFPLFYSKIGPKLSSNPKSIWIIKAHLSTDLRTRQVEGLQVATVLALLRG